MKRYCLYNYLIDHLDVGHSGYPANKPEILALRLMIVLKNTK